ncbi:transposase [Thalassoporum mexicanum PCC 7367]|uniref:IS630 family transposase n=1 Tax=Thalassoporum mexicanum TaxID=3457544 RepID=UPI00029FDB2D|nr:IS630 family transposase [Pseudanabaena sp. PCC 7367]AFY69204.1 transposase [Pseudanabaena sp. PCC 7367]AFY69713.1 transposase [Pseudanabaena sp. PCC 7367]
MINNWLKSHQPEIQNGQIRVFALDECHTRAGDICGYGWGDRQQRLEVKVDNYRDSQTYFGALDCLNGDLILQSYQSANSSSTIEFVKHLHDISAGAKILLVWDGASYHRSQAFRDFLTQINQGQDWQIHCLRFAPYAPAENPIENIWGQAKQVLRQMHQFCRSFKLTKKLFELFLRYRLFTLPDLSTYSAFSNII